MKNQNEELKFSDLHLAAFLLAKNIPLTEIIKKSPKRAIFVFPKTKECQKLVQRFSQMKAKIEPIAFASAQKRLKQLLYLHH